MALPFKVARITINGTMFGGAEQWSTGFWMGAAGADATVPTAAFMDIVATEWKKFFIASTSGINLNYQTTSYRGALHGTDGKGIPGAVVNKYEGTPYGGGGTGSAIPPQNSLVATLTSAVPRGLGSKGRMYLPGISLSISADGRIPSPGPLNIATNLKTFFAALNATVEQPGVVVNASPGSKPPLLGPGVIRPITGVRVGNVYDTQRRRRNQLVEVYSSVVV